MLPRRIFSPYRMRRRAQNRLKIGAPRLSHEIVADLVPFTTALQRALPIAILALAVVGAPLLIFEPEGLPRMRAMEKELCGVNAGNAELRRDVTRLRKQVKNLRDDPAAIERIARGELGLVRKSELVFQFTKR
jgi:cell division protein FtsB